MYPPLITAVWYCPVDDMATLLQLATPAGVDTTDHVTP
jgi:hypothetical protein